MIFALWFHRVCVVCSLLMLQLFTELSAETVIVDEATGQRRLKASSAQVVM